MLRHAFVILAGLLLGTSARAEEWPAWRGPRLDGTSLDRNIPTKWSETENVVWKTPIPGKGHSSPIVWGDRIFVTTCLEEDGKRELLCLDRSSGKVLWEKEVLTAKLEMKHKLNSFASSTPVTDGKHVWASFLAYPDMVVACYDFAGNKLWQKSPGKLLSRHGFCSSPILHKDKVILNGDQDAEAYIVALDKETGKELYRIDRPNRTRSYCTPILIESAGKPGITQMVLSGSKTVTSYDADTGKLLWIIDGPTEQYVASLVWMDQTLCLTTGFPEFHLMGINPDGEGNITKTPFIRWHIPHADNGPKGASYVPSPIAANSHFYVVSDLGYLSCMETRSGKRIWMERLGRHHSASPVSANDYLYFPDDDGTTWVLKASAKFEVVQKNKLNDELYASPAIAHGQLFLRGLHNLYCIGAK
jgi:outer membrane protein assembly factor BamB